MADTHREIAGFLFEWDEVKAEKNIKKHGVSFETAGKVFLDARRIEYFDFAHSEEEDRYITVGIVDGVLSVVYTYRENDSVRLISARRADANERRAYERGYF